MTVAEKLSGKMPEYGFDALWLSGGGRILSYVCGIAGFIGCALVGKGGEKDAFAIDLDGEAVTESCGPLGFTFRRLEMDEADGYAAVIRRCAELGAVNVAYAGELSHEAYEALTAGGLVLSNGNPMIRKVLGVKEPWEVDRIRRAQNIADETFSEMLALIKPGVSEIELAAELEYRMRIKGSQRPAFPTILVSGPNSAKPHGVPSSRKVESGDFVKLDFGATVDFYASDMTRTVAVGHATDEMRKIYQTVLDAQLAAIAAFVPGATGSEVHDASQRVIDGAGYGIYYLHNLGHSIGPGPSAAAGFDNVFEIGNVVTMEPGIYIKGFGGVRIEDMMYLSPDGPVNLTGSPKELLVL